MKKIISLSVFLVITFSVFSQKAKSFEVHRVLTNFLLQNNETLISQAAEQIPVLSENNQDTLAYVFNFEHAFVVVSALKKSSPIKAFSFTQRFDFSFSENELSLLNFLKTELNETYKKDYFSAKAKSEWDNLISNTQKTKSTTWGPFLKSVFGQANCKDQNGNYINVTNTLTPNNWSVGCVALAHTTILHHYKWPLHGAGSHSYHDNGSGRDLSADFENTYYQWDNIQNQYHNVLSTTTQRTALGELVFQSAVALDMNFASNGSSSNVDKIARIGNQYFRFTGHYESTSHPNFWNMLAKNLKRGSLVEFSISTASGAGHAIVCDGFMQNGNTNYYHLDMGWWGSSNSWYNIESDFNAGGYSIINGGIFDVLPEPELKDISLEALQNSVTIDWNYPNVASTDTFELQVKRDQNDWITLSDSITQRYFEVFVNDYSGYQFRVRAKYFGKWETESWSEVKALSRISTSINNNYSDTYLKIYPQPATTELNIELGTEPINGSLIIFDLTGKIIFKTSINQTNKTIIPTQNWQKGIYILKINTNNELITEKISIQ